MIEDLARHGYVAASINYRLAKPTVHFPAPFEDTKAALLFLKKGAGEYKIDIARIAATGESAGSHMAMLMAFEDAMNSPTDGRDPAALTSTKLRAIVNYYGPVDLTRWDVAPMSDFMWQQHYNEPMATTLMRFFGSENAADPKLKTVSPINYICKGCPPVLTFHGTIDPVVSFKQAELLHAALRKAGVPEKLVPIKDGLHGGWTEDARRSAEAQSIAFLDQYLKGNPAAKEVHAASGVK